ncbi:MAG: hypothetical protein JW727_06995 [Candidatus Aenigmarchaeota archaeon]|nr:hypothetical protein [Candidatus Aenigmarchaeota archaeon]
MVLPPNELGVLVSLFPEKHFKTLKEIQKKCGYSYERVHSAVQSLSEKGIVGTKRYGNVIVAFPNYHSDFAFLGFVHYTTESKSRFYTDSMGILSQKARKVQDSGSVHERTPGEISSCLSGLEKLDAELVSVLDFSIMPVKKVALMVLGPKYLSEELLKMEYRCGLRFDAQFETIESISRKRDDSRYLNGIVVKGVEKFYRAFYL